MSRIGVGAWAWGDRLYWGYGRSYNDYDLRGAFEAALGAGVNWFDTAEVYGFGRSEQILGQFLSSADRPVVIASKFMPFPWRLRRGSLLGALRGTLRRLGLERVDLYQIHWPFPPMPVETWMDAFAEAVQAGLVRAVGVSNYSVEQMRRAHAALTKRGVPLASNQVEYSLLERAPERSGLLDACRELGVTLIAYSPLAQGLLTGKYSKASPPSGMRGRRMRKRLTKIEPVVASLREIGEARDKTPGQVALNWLICKGAVAIPGAKTAQQAEQNAGALGWRLTDDEVVALDSVAP
ncbi:MAG: 2,5-didehydrogluconate reductase [Chloroflexi bacterium RBG_16_68_14]|nr:MAG: 2,5-didehydrogluconate reductase [Chloroflexi bacterium RBG_16_68_14]